VADGLLYNHFAGKDDLVVTALGEQAAELVHAFLAARPEPGTATLEKNLAALAPAALEFNARIVPLITGLFGQADLLGRFLDAIRAGQVGPQAAFAAAVEYVQAEQRLGRAADDVDPVAVVELLFGACQLRAFVAQLGQAADAGPEADLDAIVSVLLRALQRPGHRLHRPGHGRR